MYRFQKPTAIEHNVKSLWILCTDYGYARMTVIDSKRISLEQVSDNQNGKVVDEVMIHKDQQDR